MSDQAVAIGAPKPCPRCGGVVGDPPTFDTTGTCSRCGHDDDMHDEEQDYRGNTCRECGDYTPYPCPEYRGPVIHYRLSANYGYTGVPCPDPADGDDQC